MNCQHETLRHTIRHTSTYYCTIFPCNFRGANIRGFRGWIGGLTTNILPTNEATLPTFTCSASSHEMSQYC